MMPAGIMNNSSKQVKKKGSDGVIISVCIALQYVFTLCFFTKQKCTIYK